MESVIRFSNDNWHPIRSEWVEGMQSNAHNYLNRTNNRVESINQKLKKVISKFSNIVTFFENLMRVVSSLRMERDHKATEGCGILFNLSFNTLIFVKFKHHESFPKHFNFKD